MGYVADVRAAKIASLRKYVVAGKANLRLAAKLAGVHRSHFYRIADALRQMEWIKSYRLTLHIQEYNKRCRGTLVLPDKIASSKEQMRG